MVGGLFSKRRTIRAEGLCIKAGPTQSGGSGPVTTAARYVGGTVLPTANYWALAVVSLLILWFGFILLRNRRVIRFIAPRILRLMR